MCQVNKKIIMPNLRLIIISKLIVLEQQTNIQIFKHEYIKTVAFYNTSYEIIVVDCFTTQVVFCQFLY